MQNIFEYLKDKNIQFFDMSRIPVGKEGAHGVYSFKNATRGEVVQYNGEWVYFRRKYFRHLHYFYNSLLNKTEFY
jgi:lipid II:glycine glycyltransferase (peptidoglycan interpeptide bridge formation enzyme)